MIKAGYAERGFFDDVVSDAGHFAPWEAPGPVAEALGKFLEEPR